MVGLNLVKPSKYIMQEIEHRFHMFFPDPKIMSCGSSAFIKNSLTVKKWYPT